MKKIVIGSLVIVVLFALVFFAGRVGDILQNKSNEYGLDIEYFDENRKYVSEINFTFKMETKGTYSEEIEMRSGKGHKIYIGENSLSHDVVIVIIDDKSKEVYKTTLKAGERLVYLGEKGYDEGRYNIEITLPKQCNGTLEMKIDE